MKEKKSIIYRKPASAGRELSTNALCEVKICTITALRFKVHMTRETNSLSLLSFFLAFFVLCDSFLIHIPLRCEIIIFDLFSCCIWIVILWFTYLRSAYLFLVLVFIGILNVYVDANNLQLNFDLCTTPMRLLHKRKSERTESINEYTQKIH